MQKDAAIITSIIMLFALTWVCGCIRTDKPLKRCPLAGKFLYLQDGRRTVLYLQSYPQGTKCELFRGERWDEIYYQISPDQKRVLVEIHRKGRTSLFLVHLLDGKQKKLLMTAPGIKAAIWLDNCRIAFWDSGSQKHLDIETGRLSNLGPADYLTFLRLHFHKEIELLDKVLSSQWFQRGRLLEEKSENEWQALLMFLRTIGVPLQPPLLEICIDVAILGREAALSPDGKAIVYTTNERALCVVKQSAKRVLINPPSGYRFFHPRWIDGNHILVGLNRPLNVPVHPVPGEWVLGIVHLCPERWRDVEVITHGRDGKWLNDGAR